MGHHRLGKSIRKRLRLQLRKKLRRSAAAKKARNGKNKRRSSKPKRPLKSTAKAANSFTEPRIMLQEATRNQESHPINQDWLHRGTRSSFPSPAEEEHIVMGSINEAVGTTHLTDPRTLLPEAAAIQETHHPISRDWLHRAAQISFPPPAEEADNVINAMRDTLGWESYSQQEQD